MSVPDFLVIGAQKCGTTTLYEDLRTHPRVVLTPKESAYLLHGGYAGRLPPARAGGLVGEVTADYTMLPTHDAAALARSAFERVRAIYIVRDPVDRVISHHHHHVAAGLVDPDINRAVHDYPALVDNSRYATQVGPWIEAFGRDSVLVVKFEDYMSDRQAGFDAVVAFLGLPHHTLPEPERVHNAATDRRVVVGRSRRLLDTRAYRGLRRLVPHGVRRWLVRLLLPEPPPRPPGPSEATRAWLVDQLDPEVHRLADLLGVAPFWQLRTKEDRT